MKTTTNPNKPALKRRAIGVRARPIPPTQLSDEEFRRQLHIELADEIAAAQFSFAKIHGHLLRPHTPTEIKTRAAAVRAMFAQWEKEDRKDPPPYNDWDKFKALLEENRMRSAPIFAE